MKKISRKQLIKQFKEQKYTCLLKKCPRCHFPLFPMNVMISDYSLMFRSQYYIDQLGCRKCLWNTPVVVKWDGKDSDSQKSIKMNRPNKNQNFVNL